MTVKFNIWNSESPSKAAMSDKAADQLKALLLKKKQAEQWRQAEKPANPLANKQNRWQRFNRYVWDKKQG